jgi:predicted NAD/FAD-binding protein
VTLEQEASQIPMDTGFLVYNELTYPHLTAFFKALNVETILSDMSLSIQSPARALEWAGTSLGAVFAQRQNIFNLRFLKMLKDVLRFNREAVENCSLARAYGWSLGALLRERRFSDTFAQDYLVPMGAAIWSTPESQMFEFPAETFLNFFMNHKLLQITNRPVWKTVKNGSIQYVKKVQKLLGSLHLGDPVVSVRRLNHKIEVSTQKGVAMFDAVVMATHAAVTAKILQFNSEDERKIIHAIRDQVNTSVLHSDARVMPKKKQCWASWNVLSGSAPAQAGGVSLTYHLNRLQNLSCKQNYFVTLNPRTPPENSWLTQQVSHPVFDQGAIEAQNNLATIQGQTAVYFAGAWSKYGFHEDGLRSAIDVAQRFGIRPPWVSQA